MKILKKDIRNGFCHIQVNNLEDLWYLSSIIDKGDFVTARTERKIKVGGSDRKSNVAVRVANITINVEKVEFSKYNSSLRISGKITSEHEDIPKGSYHTLNVEVNSNLKINKERWLSFQLDKLDEACKQDKTSVLICVLDRKEASFAILKSYGYEMLTEIEGVVEEKRIKEKQKESTFYNEIIKMLEQYDQRFKPSSIILASPAFFKEDLAKELDKNNKTLRKKVVLATCNSTGANGINEVLKRDEVKSVLKQERVFNETKVIEEILVEIAKNGNATYGFNEVENAVGQGAVKTLVVVDSLIQKLRQEEKYEKLERVIRSADSMKAEVFIVSNEHDAGKKLEGLGGIACLLRYKL
ncbi:MAG TPA: mRNA surveillance protein pelota [Candidatus Nanoarchaeia archaeon]|nr:mRNA surveillance protein pelota [Candidatus Nanoarchaeia archaeon]